jgi:DUF971 family protein
MSVTDMNAAPAKVVFHAASQVLELEWADGGGARRLSAALLRRQCPCSKCEAARIANRLAVPSFRLESAQAVGLYGLQLTFSDGHDRGIYPWSYLRGLE